MNGTKFSEIESPGQFLPVVKSACEQARRKGAQFADAVLSLGREIAVSVEKSSIKTSEAGWGKTFSIRVFIDGGMGYASTSGLDGGDVESLVDRAIELAKIATPDPDFVAIPEPQKAPREPVVFDPQILTLGPDDAIRWASENIRQAQAVDPNVIVSGDAVIRVSSSVMASSTGVELARRGTMVHLGFFCVVKESDSVGSFADHVSSRFLGDFKPMGLCDRITRRALAYKHARKVETGHTTLVLGPLAAFGLLGGLAGAASAEAIQRNRSVLADKFQCVIGPEFLSITDNGIIDRGLSSGAYDGEGAVKQVVKIIESGRFVGQLHSSYTANKAKVSNTGHGSRTRSISPSNLQIGLGQKTAEEIIREVDDGIYLELGGLDPDMVSGDISTNLDFAMKIEKGELVYPVANAMVGGNLMELLPKLDAISSDYRDEPGNKMPTIRIRDVQISGE